MLVEVERVVRATATNLAIKHRTKETNPDVIDDVVGVFWRFKSKPTVQKAELHAALVPTFIHGETFDDLEKVMRDSWQTVADRTAAEAERTKVSKQDEKRRFWGLEAGVPVAAVLLAFLVFAAPDGMRNLLRPDPCINDQIENSVDKTQR